MVESKYRKSNIERRQSTTIFPAQGAALSVGGNIKINLMKKSLLAISILVINYHFYSCSQQEVKSYNNKLNEKYNDIPGTRISLIPPNGFKIKNLAPQLIEENGKGQIAIFEMPESYFQIIKMYTPEAFKKVPNEELISTKNININGYNGTELLTKASDHMKFVLMFGNDTLCVVIGGSYLKEYESVLSDKIRKTILSVVYNPEKQINQEENLPYEISTLGTKLKLALVTQSISFYTVDGNSTPQVPDKTCFEIGSGERKSRSEDWIKQNIQDVMKYEGRYGLEVKNSNKVIIDGLNGYETIGYVKVGNDTVKVIYYVILYDDDEMCTICGWSNMDFIENINLLRKISKTFKRK